MTTPLSSRQAAPDPEEAPEPVEIPSFRRALDQTPLYKEEHEGGQFARALGSYHQELHAAEGVTMDDIKGCPLGSPERAILLQNFVGNHLPELIDMPLPHHQSRPLHLEVEPEPEPTTTYHEELDAIRAAPGGDRVRLFANLLQRRGSFGGGGG